MTNSEMVSIRSDSTGEVLMRTPRQFLFDSINARKDATEELEAARIKAEQIGTMQNVTRALQVSAFCDSINHITRRLDSFETRRRERHRRDAEEREAAQQRMIEDALSKLPDPENPTFADETPSPSGDLHQLEPSTPEDVEQLEASEHPTDEEGDLPKELTEETPPITGTMPELSGAREPTARNPVAVSLGSEPEDLPARTRLPPPPISADSLYANYNMGTVFVPDPT